MTEANDQYVIDLHDVAKTYRGKVHALRGIEMQVHRGEIFGLLGPNGAGKSTLVKIMMTVVRPTRAKGTLLGETIGNKPTLAKVGYLPEHHVLPKYLTGRQILEFYAALAKVPRRLRKKRATDLIGIVGLADWSKKKVSTYSKGMLQRLGVAQAMMNDPDLIVLDEPTDGVDPVGRRDIRDILVQLKDRKKTVFINSHLLSELEMVCDRVGILVQGRVAQQGTLDDLTADSRRYEIEIAGEPPDWVQGDPAIRVTAMTEHRKRLTIMGDRPEAVQPIIDRLRGGDRTIISIKPVRETLEDLFMRAVTDPNTGKIIAPGASTPPTVRQNGGGA